VDSVMLPLQKESSDEVPVKSFDKLTPLPHPTLFTSAAIFWCCIAHSQGVMLNYDSSCTFLGVL